MELYYFGARYYDAATGVWLTQDVYRGEAEQPLTLHRTLYVLANPVNNVDPYGYAVIANGYGGYGGGGGPVDTGDPAPSSDPANSDNSSPCHWDGNGDNGGSGGGGRRDDPAYEPGVLTGPLHEGLSGPEPSDILHWGFNRLRDWASRKVLETPIATWSDMPGASGITIGGTLRAVSEIRSFVDLARESEGDVGVEEWFWAAMRADLEITGTKESVTGFLESGIQLTQDTQVVFSNAPLEERFWSCVKVGLFGEAVALMATGFAGIRPNLPGGMLERRLAAGGHTEALATVKGVTTLLGGRPTYDVDAMVYWAQEDVVLGEQFMMRPATSDFPQILAGEGEEAATRYVLERQGMEVPPSVESITYDPTLKSVGRTTHLGGGRTSTRLGPAAFSSEGQVASSLGHETQVHAVQYADEAAGVRSLDWVEKEIEAYGWEIQNSGVTGLSGTEFDETLANWRWFANLWRRHHGQ